MDTPEYTIRTSRLGLRNWRTDDIGPYIAMNMDPEVMRYFPALPTPEQTRQGLARFQSHFDQHGYTYFAVDDLNRNQWIGFVGLLNQDYESPYTPFVDIGWRLQQDSWGQGLATEAAQACLEFARTELKLGEVYSTASWKNQPSLRVMNKIGMSKVGEFVHPRFDAQHELQPMHVYNIRLN